jgi:hypothetical protein
VDHLEQEQRRQSREDHLQPVQPNCAKGPFVTYKVTVTLSKVVASYWSNDYYVRYFSSMKWAWRHGGRAYYRHYHMNKYGVWTGKII